MNLRARLLLLALSMSPLSALAQKAVPLPVPVPQLPGQSSRNPEPTSPEAQDVSDAHAHVAFHLPPGWYVSHADGELSTFRLDARTATRQTQMRSVATLAFNPFPFSTFSGATVYLSMTPHATAASCAAQTTTAPVMPGRATMVAGIPFARGHDEHGQICTEARDEIFTAMHEGACVRFDLIVNTFCGGAVSGAKDLTDAQLDELRLRLESILATAKFTK